MKNKIDRTKGTYIFVESVSEGNPECRIVIVKDGELLVESDPETMDFDDAVSVADEMRIILELPADHGIITHGAMIANKKYVYN